MESQKLKTQKLKCYVLGPKSQKFPTAENTRYTVYLMLLGNCVPTYTCYIHVQNALQSKTPGYI